MTPLIFSILTTLLVLVIGIIAYWNDKKKIANRVFLALITTVVFWMLSVILRFHFDDVSLILWSTRMSYTTATIIAFFINYFCYHFPTPNRSRFPLVVLVLTTGALAVFTLLTPHVYKNVLFMEGEQQNIFGPYFYFFAIFFPLNVSWGIFNLFKKKKYLDEVGKVQVDFVTIGISLSAIIAFSTNFIIPLLGNTTKTEQYGPIAIIFFIIFSAYAILKHHLFDIKVIAAEIFTLLLTLVVFLNIFNYNTLPQLFFNILIFLGTGIFGIFLIRAVLWEVKTREELERLAADLSAANEQLTTLDRAKSEFIAIASHQLRTPLTAIKGYISLLMEGTYGVLREKQKKPMNGVFQSAERLIRLVNDLLSISRIESGKIEAKLAPTDIKKLIEGVIEELRVKVEGKGLTLDLKNSHGAMPTIMADEEKIRNVLMNIIDNAIRYTSKGGIAVYLKLEEAERKIRIEIKDTGEGMTREEMSKLFESFSRGTAGQRIWTEGAGLGLYIAKKFIEMHKGRVWAESSGKGKGSEFVIELPIA